MIISDDREGVAANKTGHETRKGKEAQQLYFYLSYVPQLLVRPVRMPSFQRVNRSMAGVSSREQAPFDSMLPDSTLPHRIPAYIPLPLQLALAP